MRLKDKVIEAILDEARNHGADSPVDYGDAEQLAERILAMPELTNPELAKPPLSPWWNSKERWEQELGRKL